LEGVSDYGPEEGKIKENKNYERRRYVRGMWEMGKKKRRRRIEE